MNQAELRQMAEERVKDAKALLDGLRWEFAYYTAGYAVECGLKACVLARMIHTAWIFQEKWKADICLTHDFGQLLKLADLERQLFKNVQSNRKFAINWGTAAAWKVSSRYESKKESEATELYAAITDNPDGVLKWIQNYW